MRAKLRTTPESVRRLLAQRAYRVMSDRYYPIGMVEHEPGFVTGLTDGEGDQAEVIERLVQAADVWTWV